MQWHSTFDKMYSCEREFFHNERFTKFFHYYFPCVLNPCKNSISQIDLTALFKHHSVRKIKLSLITQWKMGKVMLGKFVIFEPQGVGFKWVCIKNRLHQMKET